MDRLAIAYMGTRGDGVAGGPHGPLYLPFTLPNEEIIVESDVNPPKLVSLARPSADRVAPICRHFGNCGGCKLQHWRGEPYLAWKGGLVAQALRARGVEVPVGAIVDAHGMGRRRATLHARREGEAVRVGFMRSGSHAIVAVEACPVLAPALAGSPHLAADIAEILMEKGKPLDIGVTLTETGLDVVAKGHGPLAPKERERLVGLAERHDLARLANHHEVIVERRQPFVAMGPCRVVPPPGAFLQATAQGEVALAALVAEGVGEARNIADLFSGVGPFGLRHASMARISAFDSDREVIAALLKAARGVAGLKPVRGDVRDLFRRPLLPTEINDFDAIVLDPPRQGAQAQILELARSKARRVVYVSCNPVTFARDAAILIHAGWRLERVTPVDQFRYSVHVELVGLFTR